MSSRSPKSEAFRALPDTVVVARVRRPHGVRGEVLVESLTHNPRRFAPGSVLQAVVDRRGRRRLRVAASREHPLGRLLRLEGVESRDEAEAFRGAVLEVDRSAVPPAPPGSYYYFELEGCRCRDRRAGDLGEVAEVVEDGGGVLLRVAGEDRELLLPFAAEMIVGIDLESGAIDLDLPPGLVETCASPS